MNRRHGSLDEDLQSTPVILESRVAGAAGGFYGFTPGTLLRLRVLRTLRSSFPIPPEVFAFVPMGNIAVGSIAICKGDPFFPPLPRLGERVLTFTSRPAGAANNVLTLDGPDDLAVQRGGRLLFSASREDELSGNSKTVGLEDVRYRVENYDRLEKRKESR